MPKKNRLFIPTNTENLKMMIAQGLISSPEGFRKYYSDTLEFLSGYIPLFKNRVPADILNSVIKESNDLLPCIVEINLNKIIEGGVKLFNNNELIDSSLKDIENIEFDSLIFILAPLPLQCISKVIFRTIDEKESFEKELSLYSNVILNDITIYYSESDEKLFRPQGVDEFLENFSIENIKNINTCDVTPLDYKRVYAFGGLLNNLFYFSKNGQISHDVFNYALNYSQNLQKNTDDIPEDVAIILDCIYKKPLANEENIQEIVYRGLVEVAIKSDNFKDDIIEFLNSKEKTHSIAKKLINFESINYKPVSQEFKEAKTRYGKALLMMFVREDSESLIDYELDLFDETDYLVFAMLFGIRDKFSKVPKFIREFEKAQNFISTKMANHAHSMLESSIRFKEENIPPTIMKMLKNNRFKEYLAKKLNMEDCFQTKIPSLNYKVVKGKPVLPGIVMPKFEILEDQYFKFMSKHKLTDYNKYVEKYKKIR
jgi:hypothetical protein